MYGVCVCVCFVVLITISVSKRNHRDLVLNAQHLPNSHVYPNVYKSVDQINHPQAVVLSAIWARPHLPSPGTLNKDITRQVPSYDFHPF